MKELQVNGTGLKTATTTIVISAGIEDLKK
jgi:hypothetical protein